MFFEIVKFLFYSILIVIISKYILVKTIRKLAEVLKLKPKIIGEISGYATSIPELLTITISSFSNLVGASLYNVLSSNIINFLQYFFSIILNKNFKCIKNKAIRIQLLLSIITILIPVIFFMLKIETNLITVPIFIILYLLFRVIINKIDIKYLTKEENLMEKEIEKEVKEESKNTVKNKETTFYVLILILSGVLLYFIGERLGNVLENLCNIFNIKQFVIGILLGVITSIPELITFFEAQKHYKKNNNKLAGVVETTNNLLTSNMVNLFIIQSIGIIIFALINM